MSDFIKMKARMIVISIALVSLVLGLVACAKSESDSTTDNDASAAVDNDSAVEGTLEAYDPTANADGSNGKSIEGSDEEKLQQERIAGGAVGGIVSKNLEPLEGITDYSTDAATFVYGMDSQPPTISQHYGSKCLSCHIESETGTKTDLKVKEMPKIPPGHISAKLKNADCTSCHATK
jgi:hypothetical protein